MRGASDKVYYLRMLRLLLILLAASAVLAALTSAQVLPAAVDAAAWEVLGVLWWLAVIACPLVYWAAPGLFHHIDGPLGRFAARLGHGRRDAAELLARIEHMGKPHHMVQLGQLYLHQGRWRKAAGWLERAVALEPHLLEARYKLAQCYLAQRKTPEATELFEQVYAAKPDHDYGTLYLRLAQCHHRLGNDARAGQVFEQLLRFYPGHAEGGYSYALLLEQLGQRDRARQLMREVITAVHRSPRFQRRRTRHWAWKARWWLWMH